MWWRCVYKSRIFVPLLLFFCPCRWKGQRAHEQADRGALLQRRGGRDDQGSFAAHRDVRHHVPQDQDQPLDGDGNLQPRPHRLVIQVRPNLNGAVI